MKVLKLTNIFSKMFANMVKIHHSMIAQYDGMTPYPVYILYNPTRLPSLLFYTMIASLSSCVYLPFQCVSF